MREGRALVPVPAAAAAILSPATALAQFSMEDDDAGIPAPPPAAAPGQATVDEGIEGPGAPPWAIVPEDPTVGHVATVNELMDAHKDLTGIMEAQSGGDYSTPDYPFVMTYVDEENEELVVMMHTMAALAGIEYEEREIQVALDTEADIKITYGTVELDATPVQIESWKQYYRANCLPSYKPGYQTACILYEGYLRENGVDPSSLGTPSTPTPTLSTADPCAQSRSSLACYYYTQYKSRCLPTASTSRCSTYATQITTAGYALPTAPNPAPAPNPNPNPAPAPQPLNPAPVPVSGATVFSDGFESGLAAKWVETGEFDWRADMPDEGTNPPSHATSNRVAEADDCDTGCVLTMRSFLNLSGHASATLEFWRYIDTSLDVNEYLRVQVHSSGRWTTVYSWGGGIGDDDRWHKESYSLAGKLTNDFKVRFVAKMSAPVEEVAIDDVAVRGTLRASSDTVPPVVTVPADITRTAPSSAGVAVTYAASARDAVDGAIAPTCLPASGSTFRVGTTTVRCTATDAARNTGSASFRVTVDTADTVAPVLSLPADMTVAASSADGAYITYAASARDAVDGAVTSSCWPASGGRFFVGETTARCSARDSSGNVARGSFQVTVTPFAPAPAPGAVVLSEGFEGGLSRWVESGEPDWRTGPHDESYNPDGTRVGTTTNSVATADDCDTGCTLTLARALDLSGRTGATLTFSRFVDRSIDSGEYLRVQAHKGGSWSTIYSWGGGSGDDDRWHHESYSLSSYLVSDFKVRFVARMSSSGEEAAVDNVEVRATGGRAADTAAPVVTVPADISRTSAAGVAVTYTATARDAVDGAITPSCEPASGSTFAVGTTTVRCAATDAAGNTGRAMFTVTVTAPDTAAPVMTAPSAMSFTATSAAGATVSYTVTALDAVDGAITPTCTPASGSAFAVGTTTVRCEATDSAGNTGRASFTVTVMPAPAPANQCPAPGPSGASGSSSPSACPGASTPAPTTVFEEDFESGLSKWIEFVGFDFARGTTISLRDSNWRSASLDDTNPSGSSASNKVATTDACLEPCGIELKDGIDLSGYEGATLEFRRYIDTALDSKELMQMDIHKGGKWTTIYRWSDLTSVRGSWHSESHNLGDHLVSDFKIRVIARMSDADEDVAIDDMVIRATSTAKDDSTHPVITAPDRMSVKTKSTTLSSVQVNFVVTAHDAVDGVVFPTCAPASGTEFSIGSTTVRCTVTDQANNTASVTFPVVVSLPSPDPSPIPSTHKLRGGMLVSAKLTSASNSQIVHGTSGIVLNHTNDQKALVVSSHVINSPLTRLTFAELLLNVTKTTTPLIGSAVLADVPTIGSISSDAAIVHITGSSIVPEAGKIQNGTSVISISDRGGAKSHMGKTAEIMGAFTQSAGNILYADVTIKHSPQGNSIIKTGQVIAEYWSQSGDSGAPITHTDTSGNTKLLGIHVGRAYQLFLEPSGRAIYEGNVAATNSTVDWNSFAVFSPWENIRRDLGIS